MPLLAGKAVEIVRVGVEPAREVVEVRVVHVVSVDPSQLLAHRQARDDGDVGIGFADPLVETVVVLGVHGAVVFVPDLDVVQCERFGMAVPGPFGAPAGRFGVARGIFDRIQRVLYQAFDLVVVVEVAVAPVAGHAGVADEHGLAADVLAVLQEFVVSESVGGVVAPEVVFALAQLRFPDRVLPVHAVLHREPLDDAPAGPAHECRLEVSHELRDVAAQSVGAVVERVAGEERHVVDLQRALRIEPQGEPAVVHRPRGLQLPLEIAPRSVVFQGKPLCGQHLAVGCEDLRRHASPVSVRGPDVEAQVVFLARLDGQAVETAVYETERLPAGVDRKIHGLRALDLQVVRIVDADRIRGPVRRFDRPSRMGVFDVPGNAPAAHLFGRRVDRPVRGIDPLVLRVVGAARRQVLLFEPPVEDQFRVHAPVGRTVDVLEEDAVHRRGDLRLLPGHVHRDPGLWNVLARCRRYDSGGTEHQKCMDVSLHGIICSIFSTDRSPTGRRV